MRTAVNLAEVDNTAKIILMARWDQMEEETSPSGGEARWRYVEALLEKVFSDAGWNVHREAGSRDGGVDLIVRKKDISYVIQAKVAAEGRSDRLVPLWSQACLQAIKAGSSHHPPLAVVAAPRISARAAEQVLDFAARYAPDAAAGVIDFEGLRHFRGPHLEDIDAGNHEPQRSARALPAEPVNLFSDLNQWLLKVLLAPELPGPLLTSPRGRYRNASQLARAADVSVMSAFRLVQQLQRDGYLHESEPYLRLVRREELFRNWQSAAAVRRREVPMRFLLGGEPHAELRRMARSGRACLALFAAAEALQLGFVQGVPPYVYVERLAPANVASWKRLIPAERHEVPDLILRQAPAPRSVFRGMVTRDEIPACDVLQVWLDVSAHPSRGQEQAELIRRRVLDPIIKGVHAGG